MRETGRSSVLQAVARCSPQEVVLAFQPVIGFEVHAQLSTATKLFCGCLSGTGGEPNTRTCPVCLGLPGALPVINEGVVDLGITVALALNARVARDARFARKNYFYPDLPKGYQITQHGEPIATGGHLDVAVDGEIRRVRIRQIHVEEDAGKSVHTEIDGAPASLLDMNRCGVPLLEIVTEPDISDIDTADAFLSELRSILVFLGVAECNMHEGGLRFDTNISLRRGSGSEPGTQTELKNLNSFKSVRRALAFEIERQRRLLEGGGRVEYATLVWDEGADTARTARSKEGASDYRYFPEPDLVAFTIGEGRIARLRSAMPELPAAARARIAGRYLIPDYDAGVIARDRSTLSFYEMCVAEVGKALGARAPKTVGKIVSNWVMVVLGGYLNERGMTLKDLAVRFRDRPGGQAGEASEPDSGVEPLARRLAEVVVLRVRGDVSEPAARALFTAAMESDEDISPLKARLGLDNAPDGERLAEIVRGVLHEHPEEVARYAAGADRLLRYFVGEVMKETGGRADPGTVTRTLTDELAPGKPTPDAEEQQ
ncbi:MAG: Asp-tRNA(Asn)/Glu-tRNA(Gln) amidotransferase subunit GatB [Candidatus Eisenbacteria bacterium]|nr:Asp-tRNA(Asn)/Glu-tRNA(Gln) amidotransferase subunit GatB [Candidatus Eisenbacteria bacterium]